MNLRQTAAAILTAIVMVISSVPHKASAATAPNTANYVDQVVMLVNLEREAAGLKPLQASPTLHACAGQRASELTQSFSHSRPDGSSFSTVLTGISWRRCGENAAQGLSTPASVMDGWMFSEGHRANILKEDYEYIGVGVVYENNKFSWIQIFTAGSNLTDAYLPTVRIGDVSGDSIIDSSDAAQILIAAAHLGAGQSSGLDKLQSKAADVNGDGVIDAYDASLILVYSAIRGVGNDVTLDEVITGKVK